MTYVCCKVAQVRFCRELSHPSGCEITDKKLQKYTGVLAGFVTLSGKIIIVLPLHHGAHLPWYFTAVYHVVSLYCFVVCHVGRT